jgi:ABC-2 type transport system permease protein
MSLKPETQEVRPVLVGINWQGMRTLYAKEVHRYIKIFGQTLLAPIITTFLYLIVFGVAFGDSRNVNGQPYIEFLAPGLLMMTILQNAFANTSASLIQQKLNANIVDTLMPPLSPMELTIGFVMGGATRGIMVGIGVGISLALVMPTPLLSPSGIIFYSIGAAIMMGSLGVITGIWAEKFDHVSTITNFIILPLSFLSSTFFPIERFPAIIQNISHYNPFFYIIDGFRSGFIGYSTASTKLGIAIIVILNIVLWAICYLMFRSGYKTKD